MGYKQGILNLYKRMGETPLERIGRFKIDHPEFSELKFTYAGRLDPMAHGVLPVLYGEKIDELEKIKFLSLNKEYIFEFLLGFSTDTFDILGEITSVKNGNLKIEKDIIEEKIKSFKGKLIQQYPKYSSKTLAGVPLFALSRKGEEFDPPKREVEIFEIEVLKKYDLSKIDILKTVLNRLSIVNGDFRQDKIKALWIRSINSVQVENFPLFSIKVFCSSGTYVRALANELSKKLATPALAFEILRTKVGDFNVENSLK